MRDAVPDRRAARRGPHGRPREIPPPAVVMRDTGRLDLDGRHGGSRPDPVGADSGRERGGELLVAAAAAEDFRLGPVLLESVPLDHREIAEIALPRGPDAVVGRHLGLDAGTAQRRRIDGLDPRARSVCLSRSSRLRRLPRGKRIADSRRFRVEPRERRAHLLPELFGFARSQSPAAEHDGRFLVAVGDIEEAQPEALLVAEARSGGWNRSVPPPPSTVPPGTRSLNDRTRPPIRFRASTTTTSAPACDSS